MTVTEPNGGTRFGRTVIEAVVGELIDQSVQAILYPANSRGVMGAGSTNSIRLAGGQEVEREAMAKAPIELGKAIVTSAGRLQERGIESVIHAVIVPGLGDAPKSTTVVRAIDSALELATEHRLSSLAIPLIGVGADSPDEERAAAAQSLVETVVKYVRRPGSRIERLVFVCRFDDDRASVNEAIAQSRQRSWTTPA